jgi:hypothetical protein
MRFAAFVKKEPGSLGPALGKQETGGRIRPPVSFM